MIFDDKYFLISIDTININIDFIQYLFYSPKDLNIDNSDNNIESVAIVLKKGECPQITNKIIANLPYYAKTNPYNNFIELTCLNAILAQMNRMMIYDNIVINICFE